MKNYKAQLKSWYPNGEFDSNKFEYDALNGDIDILNANQIQQKAIKVRQTATKRGTKMKMSRLINSTRRNPHMHRIANVWDMGQTNDYSDNDNPLNTGKTALNYINTKAPMEMDAENKSIMLAQKGKLMNNFAKQWNKHNIEKIVNPKQAGLNSKVNTFVLDKYPQIHSKHFKDFLNHNKYYSGINETVTYINENHKSDSHTKELLHSLNTGLKNIQNDMKYTTLSKRLQSAHRYTSTIKRHHISASKDILKLDKHTHDFQNVPKDRKNLTKSKHLNRNKFLKDAYAYKYGIGNDQIDVGPNEPIISPFEDGKRSFKEAVDFIHKMDKQSQNTHTNALLKSIGLSNPSHVHSKNNHHASYINKPTLHLKKKQHHVVHSTHGRTRKIRHDDFHI